MRHIWRPLGLYVALFTGLVLAGGEASAQKKAAASPATPTDYAQLVASKQAVGTVVAFDPAGVLTVRVDLARYEPNPKYRPPTAGRVNNGQASSQMRAMVQFQQQMRQQQLNLQRQQQQLARARTPQQKQQIMRQIALAKARQQQQQAQQFARLQADMMRNARNASPKQANANNGPYIVVTTPKTFDLEVSDKVVLRKMFLPSAFDDFGNFKVYTEEEKAKLRGKDTSQPGYTATADEVVAGQEVRVYLTAPAAARREARPDDDPEDRPRPRVNLIVLTREKGI